MCNIYANSLSEPIMHCRSMSFLTTSRWVPEYKIYIHTHIALRGNHAAITYHGNLCAYAHTLFHAASRSRCPCHHSRSGLRGAVRYRTGPGGWLAGHPFSRPPQLVADLPEIGAPPLLVVFVPGATTTLVRTCVSIAT